MIFRTPSPKSHVPRPLSWLLCALLLVTHGALAEAPAWWQTRGVLQTNATPNDYAALNVGQLKQLAFSAWQELESLPGGAGFQPIFTNAANNYAAVNVGQLKAVALPFYDRLWLSLPWLAVSTGNDYALVNIGQAKKLFAFTKEEDRSVDTDGDGMADAWEVMYGFDPLDPSEAFLDADSDGLMNLQEFHRYTHPRNSDTDGDGVIDGWEDSYGFNPLEPGDAPLDIDGDGLSNLEECLLGTNPYNPDTDDDGVNDFVERPNVVVEQSFQWFDISEGAQILTNQSVQSETVNLPFPVNFEGIERSQACVGANGWLALLNPLTNVVLSPNYSDPSNYKIGADHVYILGYFTSTWNIELRNRTIVMADITTNGNRYCVIEYRSDAYSGYSSIPCGPLQFQVAIPYTKSNQVTVSFLEVNNDVDCCLAVQSPETKSRAVYSYFAPSFIEHNIVYPELSITYHLSRTGTDPLKADTDNDGMPDKWEWDNWLEPTKSTDAGFTEAGYSNPDADPDLDELPNIMEYRLGTNPNVWDTDGDGIGDGLEVRFGYNPLNPADISLSQDLDADGLADIYEHYWYQTDPLNPDSDGDGIDDGVEVNQTHTSPKRRDSDGDGLEDWDEIHLFVTNPLGVDSDGDGLADGDEVFTYGTDPANADSDGDGLSDGTEVNSFNTLPANTDTDGDGLSDGVEVNDYLTDPRRRDTDRDGLLDYDELYIFSTSPRSWDTDGDGLSDGAEISVYGTLPYYWDSDGDWVSDGDELRLYRTDPLNSDTDGDGLSDWEDMWDTDSDGLSDTDEVLHGTPVDSPDADGDGLPDGWEIRYGLDPFESGDASCDPDGDGLITVQEFMYDTDPLNPDTDRDGLTDGEEIAQGTSPKLADTDGDRMPDKWEIEHAAEGFDPLNALDGDLDPDNDRLRNWFECLKGTNPNDPDSDGDDISDWDEIFNAINEYTFPDSNWNGLFDEWWPHYPSIAERVWHPSGSSGYYLTEVNPLGDPDQDGVDNLHEFMAGTDPTNPDTDGDGITDGDELFVHYTDPKEADTDGDGLSDLEELFYYGTNAFLSDMDGDGLFDGEEVMMFNTDPARFSSNNYGISDLVNIFNSDLPVWEQPSSGASSSSTVSLTLSVHLESLAVNASGVLRIGDHFIPVRSGDPVEYAISIPATDRSLFSYTSTTGGLITDRPVITVTQSGRTALFFDHGNLFQLQDSFGLHDWDNLFPGQNMTLGGSIRFPSYTIIPSQLCTHDVNGGELSIQSPDPKVRFLVGNQKVLEYVPQPPPQGQPLKCYITYTDQFIKVFHVPVTVPYCGCTTPGDPSESGSDCFCNCCHKCCRCWVEGCTCTPGNCTCEQICDCNDNQHCYLCGALWDWQERDPFQCGSGCAAPDGNCHDEPGCKCYTCPICSAHHCGRAYSACRFDENREHGFEDPSLTDESTCTCRVFPHAYECPCTRKHPEALKLCTCDHRYRDMEDRGHLVLPPGKSDTVGVILQYGQAPCQTCGHARCEYSGCTVAQQKGSITVTPSQLDRTGDFIVTGTTPSTQIGDGYIACRTLKQGAVHGENIAYVLKRYTVLGLDVYPKLSGKKIDQSPYWLQQVVRKPLEDMELCPLYSGCKLNDRNAITFNSQIALSGDSGTVTIENTGATCYLYLKKNVSGKTRNPIPYSTVLSPTQRSVTLSLTDWKRLYCDYRNLANGHLICTQPGVGSIKITFKTNDGQPEAINVATEQKFTAIELTLVPDYDRDGYILENDCYLAKVGKKFTFWVNDDKDDGDFTSHGKDTPSTDFPGQIDANGLPNGNGRDNVVNGRSDLIDFTPLWLDLKEVMKVLPPQNGHTYRIRSRGVRVVQTGLSKTELQQFWRTKDKNVCGASLDQLAHEASVIPVGIADNEQVAELSPAFLAKLNENPDSYGVLMAEGAFRGASLELEVVAANSKIIMFSCKAPLYFDPVESMYRWINLRGVTGGTVELPTQVWDPPSYPDSECNGKHFIFVHGLNVNEEDARCSGAEMFKRLYHAGSKAMYTAIAWHGTQGQKWYEFLGFDLKGVGRRTSNYYANEMNAFHTAPALVEAVRQLPGSKIISAHSLGNILVSSAIHDHGLAVDKYFMLNGASPSEAYDGSRFKPDPAVNPMVHDEWRAYLPRTWASCWHEPFLKWADDGRGKLTWSNRFSSVTSVAYNYYSSGDEAFELLGTTPTSGAGYDLTQQGTGRYSWSKQELFKGRNNSDDPIVASMEFGSDWAGWGFNGYRYYTPMVPGGTGTPESEWIRTYDVTTANGLPFSTLMFSSPVFFTNPPAMFNSTIDPDTQNRILSYGIPALSTAIGHEEVKPTSIKNINMNDIDVIDRPNGWWRPKSFGQLGERWLHSDMFEVAYCYVYEVFDDFVRRGELK